MGLEDYQFGKPKPITAPKGVESPRGHGIGKDRMPTDDEYQSHIEAMKKFKEKKARKFGRGAADASGK